MNLGMALGRKDWTKNEFIHKISYNMLSRSVEIPLMTQIIETQNKI